jgi:hypothetical protein
MYIMHRFNPSPWRPYSEPVHVDVNTYTQVYIYMYTWAHMYMLPIFGR